MKRLLFLFVITALAALGADLNGNWKATAETQNGTVERTFTFKVEGNKLTGETVSQMMGKSALMDGKVDGDNLSFSIKVNFQGNEMTMNYKGKVTGNELKLTASGGDGQFTIEWTAKKAN